MQVATCLSHLSQQKNMFKLQRYVSLQRRNSVSQIVSTTNIAPWMAAAASCMATWTEWYSSSSASYETRRAHGRLDLLSAMSLICGSLGGQPNHKIHTLLPMLPPLLWSHLVLLLFFFAHMRPLVCASSAKIDAIRILATSATNHLVLLKSTYLIVTY